MYLEVPRRGLGMKDDGTCGQYRHTSTLDPAGCIGITERPCAVPAVRHM